MEYKIKQQLFTTSANLTEAIKIDRTNLQDYRFTADESYSGRNLRALSGAQKAVKRTFDIIVALTALAVFSPLIAAIAIKVWLEDYHNPIFSQRRVGLNGKEFTIYKFRTMGIDSESDGIPKLCEEHDSRLTRIGAFLRNHHLDEFPQLWNVLKGDMSIVGPRPERAYFTEKIINVFPDCCRLYALRPGLFSEATLYNGYTETIAQMVRRAEMDMDYLTDYSFSRDINIIWETAYSIISGKKF